MLGKLRGFSNTKMASVLIAIIIIPFVFWGMGSVFSGGNTNNIAKVNNEIISTKDFMNYINQNRIDPEYIKKNINNNVLENIISTIVSKKLLDMEINDLNILISDKALASKIKKNQIFLDDENNFSRIKYEKFLLENNLIASDFEIRYKDEELKKNLFNFIGGGIKVPFFLANKIYLNENKNIQLEYFNLALAYDKEVSLTEINEFIKTNEEDLKEDFLDFSYSKITPKDLIGINEFNKDFFNKIDEIDNSILNESNINEIKQKYNLKLTTINKFNVDNNSEAILKEIYSKRNGDKLQLIDKDDYFLLFEIFKSDKILPDKNDLDFINKVKNNIVQKKKFELTKNIFEKIQDKKFDDAEFIKLASDRENIKNKNIQSINENDLFDSDSIKLIYSLPEQSFVIVTDDKENILIAKITSISYDQLDQNSDEIELYKLQSTGNIKNNIFSSYDLALNNKYKVKVFENTLDRIKNNFK
tara:strand:- start:1239 stop:2660 length:1422 start_codon:yes stop_codon:yes gene_type:complete